MEYIKKRNKGEEKEQNRVGLKIQMRKIGDLGKGQKNLQGKGMDKRKGWK